MRSNLRVLMAYRNFGKISEVMTVTGLSRNALHKLYHNKDLDTVELRTIRIVCDTLKCKMSELIEHEPVEPEQG